MRYLSWLKSTLKYPFRSRKEQRHSLVGPAHIWEVMRDFQINFLKQVGLSSNHFLLDLGCGTLRGGIPIIDYLDPEHYYGVDVRKEVIEEAWKELKEENLEKKLPVLLVAKDILSLNIPKEFDFMWSFSVLFHLPDEVLEDAFSFVYQHLKSDGSFLQM